MKINFLLVSRHGLIGDFHYNWQCPFVPRIGEHVSIQDLFDEGRFVVSDLDNIQSTVDDVEDFLKNLIWKVTAITWFKNGDHHMLISLFGE
jgi:hypothetical protein